MTVNHSQLTPVLPKRWPRPLSEAPWANSVQPRPQPRLQSPSAFLFVASSVASSVVSSVVSLVASSVVSSFSSVLSAAPLVDSTSGSLVSS